MICAKTAPGDTEAMFNLLAAPHLGRGHASTQCLAVKQHAPLGVLCIFIEEIQPEMP